MNRRNVAVPLHEAAQASPTLAHLIGLARESGQRLKAVEFLIPPMLRATVRPGPIDGMAWCLLVEHGAAAAKLRQVVPAMMSHLRTRGFEVTSIRLKVGSGRG